MMEHIIQIQNMSKEYGDKRAVNQLSLTIEKGEVFGLLGPNGAGKSTTILMLLGMSEPTSGECFVCGFNSTTEPIEVKRRVGYLPDNIGFYEDLTGLENLMYTARLNSFQKQDSKERAMTLLKQVGLEEAASKRVGQYSRGMKQRLGLADVLIKQPEVIVLDEPTLGIDPKGVQELLNLIRNLSKTSGITVLLSSHHLHQVQEICDRVGIFVEGKLVACGTVDELSTQLFKRDGYQLICEVTNVDNRLIEAIESLESIKTITREQQKLLIHSEVDVTSMIAELMIQSGYHLKSLAMKDYGLDEIYHHYFEGGESHART